MEEAERSVATESARFEGWIAGVAHTPCGGLSRGGAPQRDRRPACASPRERRVAQFDCSAISYTSMGLLLN